jgi:N-acetylneuraminic acid mutarotase
MKARGTFWSMVFFVGIAPGLSAQMWESVAALPDGHLTNHAFGFAVEGTGYLVAGQTPEGFSTAMYAYDPSANSWSSLPDFPGEPRGYTIGDVWEGDAWMGFGLNDDGALNDLWKYDASEGAWTEMASCPCEARYHPAFIAYEGHIYMGLGSSFGGDLDDWWDYDMASNTWSQKPSLPAPGRHHPYQFALDGIIYTGFGHNGPDIFNTWFAYNPVDEYWSQVANLPAQGRVAGTQFAHNGIGFALSGDGESHSSMDEGEFWAYNPQSDSWSQWPSHPGMSRWAPASFVIGNDVYLLQGMSYDPGTFEYMASNWKFSLVPELQNDVALDGFVGDLDLCGDLPVAIVAQIRNMGSQSPSDLTLQMKVDGVSVLSQPWSGTLGVYETDLVVLGSYPLTGVESFDLEIVETDDIPENNSVNVVPEEPTAAFLDCEVLLTTDNYGDETSWRIEAANGSTVAEGDGYNNSSNYVIPVTLPAEGCYELFLLDSYGDGLVGQGPNSSGSFVLKTASDPNNPFTSYPIFSHDGSFQFSELRSSFKASAPGVSGIGAFDFTSAVSAHPNPFKADLTLDFEGDAHWTHVQVWNAAGQQIQTVPLNGRSAMQLSAYGWASGLYTLRLVGPEGHATLRVQKM